jgi:hypothetical protein
MEEEAESKAKTSKKNPVESKVRTHRTIYRKYIFMLVDYFLNNE